MWWWQYWSFKMITIMTTITRWWSWWWLWWWWSTWWTRVSPGGAWVVLNFIERALWSKCWKENNNNDFLIIVPIMWIINRNGIHLRQPEEAPWKAVQLLSRFLGGIIDRKLWRNLCKFIFGLDINWSSSLKYLFEP